MRDDSSFPISTAAIFAGGQSSRMGQPKEGVSMWDGRPMMAHMLDMLRPISAKIVIVGECKGFSVPKEENIIQILDRHPGHGPLSALDALLASGMDHRYLVVSCDQPAMNQALLIRLAGTIGGFAFFRTESGQRLDPFPGMYPSWMLPAVENALKRQAFSIREMNDRHMPHWVTIPDQERFHFANVNTPEALIAVGDAIQNPEIQHIERLVN